MRRLCTESSCSYPGRSVPLAVRAAMGVELRAIPKGLELPSNPKETVVAMGAGLEGQCESIGIATGPYRDPDSASGGNA